MKQWTHEAHACDAPFVTKMSAMMRLFAAIVATI
jgi:hypothetical protein